MSRDLAEAFCAVIQKALDKNCRDLGTAVVPHETYVHQVGVNEGFRQAIEMIKKTSSDLSGDDDAF